ncbi:type 1 fimbrial protein [Pantoea sp. LMR881]|uniref:fimbrial protein n=1 Tax=Pantoea sp. LMR881 TaxID=3014336 RepID=UPI0022B01B3A|nr:type 1 fimbrial protein [Pantoea sp. LMR881]MCZ4060517.1 type 1 fimbrial protein [Pantoea sp. LMR881]
MNINVSGRITASPCVVSEERVSVDLGQTLQASSLASSGAGSAMVPFQLRLINCPAGTTSVTARFSGQADPQSPQRWKNIARSPASNTAVEITERSSNTLVSNGSTLISFIASGSNSTQFNLQARAYSALGSATPGDISSVITATFEYQ